MERIPEPELMIDLAQAKAYSEADFESRHSKIIKLIDRSFNTADISGDILDLGCGPGDVTFRLARRFLSADITAIDGSPAMISQAQARLLREQTFTNRMVFIEALIPGLAIPNKPYQLIVSTSFLHHLHQPEVLWQTVIKYSTPGTKVFIADLCRPASKRAARQMVRQHASGEPDVLQQDFYHSLLAAFTAEEVEKQLLAAGLSNLTVELDDYLLIYGEI
ncbi:MAG: class I SAM-dependent methyltransferase [Gammaproteobacteria bacterium]|jgi:trans-aconitate methyltransferase|nr:class I SAM-dependent methyltransferase [Gammaproteobacteria bacterium]MBT4146069.1 class I SAM-dependent methyltransferase [Gammaproteobacteria bacterium]MBT5223454.1 class I SAM-dependent methyltransferase [Gammaproteobacteria bacterium]MBT5826863.1 class I SAM-dependent methyltransferase [Gammaproteobacteria bacterium]MBT5966358.1 class I SAM-dependent methyltransferase [Gammaproteobacteria bacterium]